MTKPTRLQQAMELRDAALDVLWAEGKPTDIGEVAILPNGLHICLAKHPHGHAMLSVWAPLNGKRAKTLNIDWNGDLIELVSFRRGPWEDRLKALSLAALTRRLNRDVEEAQRLRRPRETPDGKTLH